jgi:hypothetical protein
MNFRIAASVSTLLTTFSIAAALQAQEGLPTLDEATAISQKTGRPILAMAGQKT